MDLTHMISKLVVVIHVIASIVGIGPVFVLPILTSSAKTGSQLRFVFGLMKKINRFPKTGGITLIVTGILLMIIDKMGLSVLWLNLSLLFFIVIEVIIIGMVEPRLKKLTQLVMTSEGEEIPDGYTTAMNKIAPLEAAVHVLTIVIIILMVVKPV
ncbi:MULTISPECIES: DUF2269 family protein [Paenibacillus]|uniref:DUF2269 family protein n=1 Tax=Paenibacillus TaxID=44249 RepID=UPI0021167C64|nr:MULTISPECIES: DUF2269 family protein [Paenibacillus]MDH6426335.1 putative membrane protein [Paenibacillus sp. PastH-4]MDH6442358.1 putative membrane protein [Paenibacillus sp. PastF-4]MDH6526929.1 putative membrane protein [Paenibacillus sp. PastH-3]